MQCSFRVTPLSLARFNDKHWSIEHKMLLLSWDRGIPWTKRQFQGLYGSNSWGREWRTTVVSVSRPFSFSVTTQTLDNCLVHFLNLNLSQQSIGHFPPDRNAVVAEEDYHVARHIVRPCCCCDQSIYFLFPVVRDRRQPKEKGIPRRSLLHNAEER